MEYTDVNSLLKKRRDTKIIIRILIIVLLLFGSSLEITYQSGFAQENFDITSQKLDQLLLSEPSLKGAVASISIRSASTGQQIYDHNGEIRLKPASNLKLLTAAAALSVLGEKHKFGTELLIDGKVEAGVLKGDLYFKGKGDPTLMVSDLEEMVKELKSKGITKISGALIGDDTWFDNERLSIDLPWSDETTYYGAQVSAITLSPNDDYDAGTVIVEIKPNPTEGKPPIVEITPQTNYMKIVNSAVTVKAKDTRDLTIERMHGENTIVISGKIPQHGARVKEWVSVWEPTTYTLTLFKQVLNANGIVVDGPILVNETPTHAEKLITHSSMELSELLIPFLKFSNNGHGEALVKEMGKVVKGEGSWEKGLEAMLEELEKWGVNTSTMLLRDGSGISHVNLITASQLSKLLFMIQKEEWYNSYLNALPLAASSDRLLAGTLLHRMTNVSEQAVVRAKTGTLTTVSSLSGYLTTRNGESLIFSVLLNNLLDEDDGKRIEDQIVEIIANNS
ncbi:D-alanyl-D-alanine carboxypeptidase/D-alanyl-D-alanine endopeptidase [Bacillus sp. AK128]